MAEDALFLTDQFGVDLNLAECINRQIRRLRRGCQENFTILNTTFFRYFVTLLCFSTTKSVDLFHIQADAWKMISSRKKENHCSD